MTYLTQIVSPTVVPVVGIVSAIVHLLVRLLIEIYPRDTTLLVNIMMVANIILLGYFGYVMYARSQSGAGDGENA